MKDEWSRTTGWPVHRKLQLLKKPIRLWNKNSFGDIDNNLKLVEEKLHKLDKIGDIRELCEYKLKQISSLKAKSSKWRLRKCQLLKQYSRCRNLTQKDHNSKYFHIISSINKKRILIASIQIDGINTSRVEHLK